jgi:mycofactocin precursor
LFAAPGGHSVASVRPRRSERRMNEHETEEPVVEETLVEEVSIDGMCGVY